MRPRDHASEGPSGTDGSAGQSPAQVAVAPAAPARTAPDGDAGGPPGQSGAVWDQPLPWATPGEGDEDPSTEQSSPEQSSPEQPTSAQAEPLEAQESPTPKAAAAPDEGGENATDTDDTEAAGTDSSVELWQAAVSEQQRGAHAVPAASPAAAVGGHAVSRWLLGVAVAAGGLLAAVGVSEGLSSHRSAATAKDHPLPIVGPGQGLGAAGTPTPTPTTKTPAKGLIAAGTGKAAAAAPPGVALAAADPQSAHTPASAKTPEAAPQRAATTKSSTTGQSSYLSIQTSAQSSGDYWSQSTVTVRTTKKLSALKVVLHVAQTGGVANTGVWTSLGDKVTVHTGRASDGGADYVVVLNSGITLDAGSYVFQFQYNHDKGARDMVHDVWGVVTTAVGDSKEEYQTGRY